MPLPLEDIKVIDAAEMLAGPGAAMFLADQGAQVIKLEQPKGDIIRRMNATPDAEPLGKGFLTLNRNKRSIVVDLKTAQGQSVLQRLVNWADVFITSMRTEVAKRLGTDYESLSSVNPRLVYGVMSGYGPKGSEAGKPGYDLVFQARAGIVDERHHPDGTPVTPYLMISDISGAMFLPYAIMSALWERQRSGLGQKIDISLLGMALGMQVHALVRQGPDDTPLPGMGASALSNCYQCADGKWLMVVAPADHQWQAICQALDLPHLAEDPMFTTHDGRSQHTPELYEILSALFITAPLKEWQAKLEPAGVACGPVKSRDDVFNDQQILANDMMITYDHPIAGRVDMVGYPFTMSRLDNADRMRLPAPNLGEQTREILSEIGCSGDEINQLFTAGVVSERRAESGNSPL